MGEAEYLSFRRDNDGLHRMEDEWPEHIAVTTMLLAQGIDFDGMVWRPELNLLEISAVNGKAAYAKSHEIPDMGIVHFTLVEEWDA